MVWCGDQNKFEKFKNIVLAQLKKVKETDKLIIKNTPEFSQEVMQFTRLQKKNYRYGFLTTFLHLMELAL